MASKYGGRGFTESALRDLGGEEIQVTHITPGEVATPMLPEEDLESRRMLDLEDVADAIINAVSRSAHFCINDLMIILSGQQ